MIRKIFLMGALMAVPVMASTTQAKADEYCREYTKTVTIGGRSEQAYGTACYQPDGSWEVVSLEGSDYGRTQVRQVMFEDLQRDYRRAPATQVVVVERSSRPNYKYNRYASRNYNRQNYQRPVVINFDFNNKKSNRDYKEVRYERGRRGR